MALLAPIFTSARKAIGGVVARATSIPLTFMIPTWADGVPAYSTYNYQSILEEGYKRCAVLFACIEARATSGAAVSLKIYDSHTHEELINHPAQQLLSRPNPSLSEHDFWRMAIANLDLAGLAAFQKRRNKKGNVIELWPLRSDWFGIARSASTFIDHFTYREMSSPPVNIDPNDVLLFIHSDPRDMLTPISRAAAAGNIIDTDLSITDYIKMYWEQGGTPHGYLSSKLKLTPAQVDQARQNWARKYGGFRNWNAPAVLDSDTTYIKIGDTLRDAGIPDLDGRNEARICAVMGVPPIIVGTTIGMMRNTFSNYEEARRAWWEDVLIPLYKKLADRIMIDLILPEFGDGIYVKWDMAAVPALRDDQNSRWARATSALQVGGITLNEFRHEVGLPNDPKGDIYLRNYSIETAPGHTGQPADADWDDDPADGGRAAKAATIPDAPTVPGSDAQADPFDLSEAIAEEYGKRMVAAAESVKRGDMTPDEFRNAMAKIITDAYNAQAHGAGSVDEADRQRIAASVADQMKYLDGFVADLKDPTWQGDPVTRAMLYARSSRAEYWRQASPVPLPTVPGDGSSECKTNCKCWLIFDTDSEPGYCLVTWRLGAAEHSCSDCIMNETQWRPLRVQMEKSE